MSREPSIRRDTERLRRSWRAGLEYFGLAEDPSRPPEGTPRDPEWFVLFAPVVWALVAAGRTGLVFGLFIGVAMLPLALNEWRESQGGPHLRRIHPYIESLLWVPVCPALLALIAPDAAAGWFVIASLGGSVLSLVGRRREVVRKANGAGQHDRTHAA